ncbi:TatD family hydrolase [Agromyces binzhouensis]|uniref:TatD family hydrolase n=1 Tax=Agromyces binzhouensis TaxID=1817495 RepID=UPI003638981C
MSPALPPLDLHAHVKTSIPARDLERLGAVVFAATRSIDEFSSTQRRRDAVTVWGIGCHPGVQAAQRDFDPERFASLARTTPYVSEVGLDRRSRVPMATQLGTFRAILQVLSVSPRIASIHSSGAHAQVLDALSDTPIRGAILHWWRGNREETARAVSLGCWFSVNAANLKFPESVAMIPFDRILTETDHPSGDRDSAEPRQPGAVNAIEASLARVYGVSVPRIRRQIWHNFACVVDEVEVSRLLPTPVQRMLTFARDEDGG